MIKLDYVYKLKPDAKVWCVTVQEVVKFLVLMIAMLLAKTIVIILVGVDVTSLVVNHVVAAVLDIVVMVVLEQWHYSKKYVY